MRPLPRSPRIQGSVLRSHLGFLMLLALQGVPTISRAAEFQAGAAIVDVTPAQLPVLVNGGMLSRTVGKVKTPVNARALVMSDGREQIAMVIVDSCMMPRALLDEVKARASQRCGIATNRITISATHAHSAPSSMGCLGTDADPRYLPWLRDRIVEAIAQAQSRRVPARMGFARADASKFNALRQWIRRPDRLEEDPFGNKTVRANMHAGKVWDDVTGEAGPKDPELTLLSLQHRDGRPLAILGNFSMHYFGDDDISADYYGLFCEGLQQHFSLDSAVAPFPFVAAMSHGCSGDIWRRDYTRPESEWDPKLPIETYARGLVDLAVQACRNVTYRSDITLGMEERRIPMKYRVPNKQLLEWSRRVVDAMTNGAPATTPEVYAREQLLLHELQQTDVIVQAIRLGDILIATSPCETYAVTGLKLKAASPLAQTMVIELANGGDGYIPPPEQHLFGGYNTWPARSAGLEVAAEPRILETALELMEAVSGKPRKDWVLPLGPLSRAILAARPHAYWQLNDVTGPIARDASGNQHHAALEPHITYYLPGPLSRAFTSEVVPNRSLHFVGGRLRTRDALPKEAHTILLWLWNGMPETGRGVAGWFLSHDFDHGFSPRGEHLGVSGTNGIPGRLCYVSGASPSMPVFGVTTIPRWEWHAVAFVRDGDRVRIYLDGQLQIETSTPASAAPELFLGGRSDNDSNWEGRLDEVAVFHRALSAREIRRLCVVP